MIFLIIILIMLIYFISDSIKLEILYIEELEIYISFLYGKIKKRIDYYNMINMFISRNDSNKVDTSEVVENTHKIENMDEIVDDVFERLVIEKNNLYIKYRTDDITELLGLVTTYNIVSNFIAVKFLKIKKKKSNINIDFQMGSYDYECEIDCIFRIRMIHIINILLKNIKHLGILIKRFT